MCFNADARVRDLYWFFVLFRHQFVYVVGKAVQLFIFQAPPNDRDISFAQNNKPVDFPLNDTIFLKIYSVVTNKFQLKYVELILFSYLPTTIVELKIWTHFN